MADGFTDDMLAGAISGALSCITVGATFSPEQVFFYESNPELEAGYDTGGFPLMTEKSFFPVKGYNTHSMTPGIPGTYQNSNEVRWTNNEVVSVTITHIVIIFNANMSWFTLELATPVTVAAGGIFKRYPGTIIAKITR